MAHVSSSLFVPPGNQEPGSVVKKDCKNICSSNFISLKVNCLHPNIHVHYYYVRYCIHDTHS